MEIDTRTHRFCTAGEATRRRYPEIDLDRLTQVVLEVVNSLTSKAKPSQYVKRWWARAPQSSARSTRTGMGVPPAHLWFHLRACNSCVRGRPSHTTSNTYRLVAYCRTGVCYLSGHLGSLTAASGHKNGQGITPGYHLLANLLYKSSIMVPRVPGCGRDL